SNSVIGENCRIHRGVFLKDAIILKDTEIAEDAKVDGAIVGRNVDIGSRAVLEEGVVVGDETQIGRDATIKPYVKIWPKKYIEEESLVSNSVIWRERWRKNIFGSYGVTGICNVDITPQFASALGAAYGSTLGKGARISCSRDSHRASRMIYRALISGILSTGVNVSNLEMVPIPVNRYELRSPKSQGGFHVRKSPFDRDVLDIKFFDANGMDLSSQSEKKIERIFFAEDFTRATVDDCGELSYPIHRVAEEYKDGMLHYLNEELISTSGLKMVIDYAFGSASQIFPSILGEFGVDAIALAAYFDESKITKDREAFDRALEQIKQIVRSIKADFGVMLDTGGEKVFLCDERGEIINGHKALGIMSLLSARANPGATIAVPIKESRVIDELVKKYGGRVVRTRNSSRGIMEAACRGDISFLGESQGGFIFSEFMPSFDGMLSICKLMEFLSKERVKMSELNDEVPDVNVLMNEVHCSTDQKGLVMRRIRDEAKGYDRVETLDGLKFWRGNSWVLILPDPMRPVISIYAESDTLGRSQQLLDEYRELIEKIKEKG
ncbi:MAG: nucleotidyltransferase, partial [bacterium]